MYVVVKIGSRIIAKSISTVELIFTFTMTMIMQKYIEIPLKIWLLLTRY